MLRIKTTLNDDGNADLNHSFGLCFGVAGPGFVRPLLPSPDPAAGATIDL